MSFPAANLLSYTTHNLPMFHDGSPVHTHSCCSHCYKMQRTHGGKLSRCKGCSIDMYCSKECQVAHWPTHKVECKLYKAERLHISERAGISNGPADVHEWMRYYDAALKNCAVAAMGLPEHPHSERKHILYVQLHHKGDSSLPVERRFEVSAVGLRELGEFPPLSMLNSVGDAYAAQCARGKVELGQSFYGVLRIGVSVVFGEPFRAGRTSACERIKHFSTDKEVPRAKVTRQDWWMLFREYVQVGAKIKFCCGRLPGAEDICCCGLVHDTAWRDAFNAAGNYNLK